jgi:hypothetical protein
MVLVGDAGQTMIAPGHSLNVVRKELTPSGVFDHLREGVPSGIFEHLLGKPSASLHLDQANGSELRKAAPVQPPPAN